METISVSNLKAHLSGELKKVRSGARIVVLDHNHPVAELVPLSGEDDLFVREAKGVYEYKILPPLINRDIQKDLDEERRERW